MFENCVGWGAGRLDGVFKVWLTVEVGFRVWGLVD